MSGTEANVMVYVRREGELPEMGIPLGSRASVRMRKPGKESPMFRGSVSHQCSDKGGGSACDGESSTVVAILFIRQKGM